jgi:hypothetical protein
MFFFFFIEIENYRDEGNILMRHTHDTPFSEKQEINSGQFF